MMSNLSRVSNIVLVITNTQHLENVIFANWPIGNLHLTKSVIENASKSCQSM